MLFSLKDTTVERITPYQEDEIYEEAICETCGGFWDDGFILVTITFGNGQQYNYQRSYGSLDRHSLSTVIDYLFTHLNDFSNMTQNDFIDHLTTELDHRFGYN